MSNLQPTPIVDKNGVATTRNKRVDKPAKGSDRVAAAAVPSTTPVAPQAEPLTAQEFVSLVRELDYASAQTVKVRDEALALFNAGAKHQFDHHYETMWIGGGRAINITGGTDGWSEAVIREKLERTVALRELLNSGAIEPREVIGSTETYTLEEADRWLLQTEEVLQEGLNTKGRSLFKNAKDALLRWRDFEGGGNLT